MDPITDLRCRASVALAAALLWSACSVEESDEAPVAVARDSLGVTIVENGPATNPAVERWSLGESPLVVIGTDESEPGHLLTEVVGGFRLTGGAIVLGDRGSGEVRWFSAEGRHLRTVGGQGEGPGEFRLLFGLDRMPGDTVVASAWPLGLRAWWDADGAYIDDTESGRWGPGFVGGRTLPDGTFLIDVFTGGSYGNSLELWAATGDEDTFRSDGHLTRVARDGTVLDTIGQVIGEEWFKRGQLGAGGDFAMRPRPFTHRTHMAFSADRILMGESNRGEVRVHALDGTVTRIIRWEKEQTPITGADRRSFRRQTIDNARNPSQVPNLERWLTEVTWPEQKPAFRSFAVDDESRLWIQAWTVEDGVDRWMVFDPEGTLVATLDGSSGQRILHAGGGYVLLAIKDDFDVETVQLFELITST